MDIYLPSLISSSEHKHIYIPPAKGHNHPGYLKIPSHLPSLMLNFTFTNVHLNILVMLLGGGDRFAVLIAHNTILYLCIDQLGGIIIVIVYFMHP